LSPCYLVAPACLPFRVIRVGCLLLPPVDTRAHVRLRHSQEEIFGSAYASAVYIAQILNLPKDKKVFVIGESGLEDELRSEGLTVCGGSVRMTAITSVPVNATPR
jgi:hypothetical protein